MKIKRYMDTDMRQVLKRVRQDQGPDAVILSNRRVPEGIEVIAAIDYDEALMRHALGVESTDDVPLDGDVLSKMAEPDESVPRSDSGRDAVPDILSADLRASSPGGENLRTVQAEIASLRGLLETQMSGLVWKDINERSPLKAQILRNLARLGVGPDVANIIIDRLGPIDQVRSMWQAPLAELAQILPVREDRLLSDGGVFALIGPTGVGKTTTIAKIAAHYVLDNDPDDVAFISADTFRIGAREHLQAFANIIGVSVFSASTANELSDLLTRLQSKRLVLIDTEGRSPRDHQLASRLAAYGRNSDRVRFYLTLSAASQEASLEEAVRQFSQVPLEGCVLTKIDEAAQLGCAITTLIRNDLRAVWFADGQRIPEDLHTAANKKLWLVNQAVNCIEHSQPAVDERVMAEQFARLEVANA